METATLPDGQQFSGTIEQHRQVWSLWRQFVRHSLAAGTGVRIHVDGDDVIVSAVYAPQWEANLAVVRPDGSVGWNSEQDAPDLPSADGDDALPWDALPVI